MEHSSSFKRAPRAFIRLASLLAIANEKQLWKAHGLQVDAKVFTNGPLQIQALEREFGVKSTQFGAWAKAWAATQKGK